MDFIGVLQAIDGPFFVTQEGRFALCFQHLQKSSPGRNGGDVHSIAVTKSTSQVGSGYAQKANYSSCTRRST